MAPKRRLIIAVSSTSPVQYVLSASDGHPSAWQLCVVRRTSREFLGEFELFMGGREKRPNRIRVPTLEGVHRVLGEWTAHHGVE
jgi:hypothetical protein